ncbi:restriction endonuclease fold toxin 5 domain-containing protein [Xenorhabdus bovienii]|uniref:restriction endonuclease fold toxin 5 domain-containing protein n=1 Tax=Xenorhabdus bovienii TaxID=40576 RepID=UPI001EE05051|nr:restriction endonuclease fold toxin 5 domain-containing protein [Xenorhabdus bovienii]MCG3462199.1 restriction endonuclease fold toxin 5 domain-containing protein [Xenorhabdus bovienii]
MPLPLVFAGPVLVAAAEYTLTALAGIAIGVGVGVGIDEATKDKEEDKAKTETGTIASSRTKCEKCPAIGNVIPYWESASISATSTIYQIQICNSVYNPETNQIQVWKCRVASFDGWKPEQCLFLEAKGKHDQFFEDGEPKFWWKGGHSSMMSQAARQQEVCTTYQGIPNSHWHFMEPISFSYYSKAFSGFQNIKVFYTPFFE